MSISYVARCRWIFMVCFSFSVHLAKRFISAPEPRREQVVKRCENQRDVPTVSENLSTNPRKTLRPLSYVNPGNNLSHV